MTHPTSGRFDVHATGELCGDFDTAEERARLLKALNADRDLCSALLCGEQQMLCRGVEWSQAQSFAALMRECGVVTEVVRHGEFALAAVDDGDDGDGVEQELWLPELPETAEIADDLPLESEHEAAAVEVDGSTGSGSVEGAGPAQVTGTGDNAGALDWEGPNAQYDLLDRDDNDRPAGARRGAQTEPQRPRLYAVYDAELVTETVPPPRSLAPRVSERAEAVVAAGDSGGGDIPIYLLEADERERSERRRHQRRWGIASLLVLVVALGVAFSGREESFSSSQAYVHVLAGAVGAGADGVVAELLVEPGQPLQPGEAVAVIVPAASGGEVAQRQIEVAPEEGVVDQIGIKVGQQVQRGDSLLTLARPGSAYLLAYFTPEQLREIPQRAIVQIEFDDFPGSPVLGRLGETGVGTEADSGGRTRGAVRIDFEDQRPILQRLRSGMAASVTIRRQAGD